MRTVVQAIPFRRFTCQNKGFPSLPVEANRAAPIPLSAAILPESIRFVISREVDRRLVFMRILRTLVGVLVFALASGFPAIGPGLIPSACAEEEEAAEPVEEDDSQVPAEEKEKKAGEEQVDDNQDESNETDSQGEETDEAEPRNDTDQDAPVEKPADEKPADEKSEEKSAEKSTEKADEKPAAEKKATKSTDKKKQDAKKEQEAAADAADEKVSEAQKADEEEEAKAAEDEAAGKAPVEIDESDEVEEEPEESEKSPNKPVVNEATPPQDVPSAQKRVIGATATIMEKQSELLFRARVDSGAKSCSLHIEDYKIENESETMAENIGKVVRFNIKNGDGESHWLEAKIASYVIVKNAAHRERRYKVPLTFRYKDFEKTVLVTLNNRDKMEFPLLLGRNFLMGDFIVDVEVDNNDLHTR
jgi:hypothetical protein